MATTTRTFAKAIYDRFKADQSAGTAFALTSGRLYNTRAPSDTEWPYIVMEQISGNPDRTFSTIADRQRWRLSVFSKNKSDMQEATDIKDALQSHFDDRVYSMSGSGLTTYTLKRSRVIDHRGPLPDGDRTRAMVDIEIQAQE